MGDILNMTDIFNKKEFVKKRQYLRKNMTKAEIILWSKLKGKQLNGLKFRRQYGINNYVVDFYCPELRLAIEIDGDVHFYDSRITCDKKRQKEIEALGIKVLRYTNNDVIRNLKGVLNDIVATTPLSPPSQGGDFLSSMQHVKPVTMLLSRMFSCIPVPCRQLIILFCCIH